RGARVVSSLDPGGLRGGRGVDQTGPLRLRGGGDACRRVPRAAGCQRQAIQSPARRVSQDRCGRRGLPRASRVREGAAGKPARRGVTPISEVSLPGKAATHSGARHGAPTTRHSVVRVLLWMSGVLLSFTAMAPSIRALSKTLSIFEILSIRTATGLVVLSALALARPQLRLQLNTRQIWLQATRNVLSFAGGFAWSLALTLLP